MNITKLSDFITGSFSFSLDSGTWKVTWLLFLYSKSERVDWSSSFFSMFKPTWLRLHWGEGSYGNRVMNVEIILSQEGIVGYLSSELLWLDSSFFGWFRHIGYKSILTVKTVWAQWIVSEQLCQHQRGPGEVIILRRGPVHILSYCRTGRKVVLPH